jgi:Asp-tRNA(Asn)/Glu-tRNA(Gln) amidotransferase A subunit family amidase
MSPTAQAIALAVNRGHDPLGYAQGALQHAQDLTNLNALIHAETHPECLNSAGILAGVPITLKDNLLHAGRPAQAASNILEGYIAPTNAHIVDGLQAAGAVIIGRSNMDEFAMGSTTETSCYGPCLNPWDLNRVPGGSWRSKPWPATTPWMKQPAKSPLRTTSHFVPKVLKACESAS